MILYRMNEIIPAKELIAMPKTKIEQIKELAIDSLYEFFRENTLYDVTTKEFKDMVSILKDLDTPKPAEQTTVNILVQNLANKFIDDC